MTSMTIIKAGPFSSIQDAGRIGYQHLGVPRSGALDLDALFLGNTLLGNEYQTSAIEICFGNFMAEVSQTTAVTLTGSQTACLIRHGASGHDETYPAGSYIRLEAGDRIEIPPFGDSLSVLLCLAGGIDVPFVYGSQSTTLNAKLGGFHGRCLQDGDRLTLLPSSMRSAQETRFISPDVFCKENRFHILFGPQDFWFTTAALTALESQTYKISPQTSRMGMRLIGPELQHKNAADIISDAMMRGVLQVPADGQPIIAMADHGTMGGYPKIACIISSQLSALGRLRPHDEISFEVTTEEQAAKMAHAHQRRLKEAIKHASPALR